MSWTRREALACAVGVCATAGCLGRSGDEGRPLPETPTGTWHQSGHDAGNTAVSAVTVPDRGTPAWSGGGAETIAPLVVGKTVYAVGDGLTALDAQSGERRWHTDLGLEPPAPSVTRPAVAGDHLLVGTKERLVSIDTADGSQRWERSIAGFPIGPMAATPDHKMGILTVERPAQDEPVIELVAFAVTTGEIEWTAPLRSSVVTSPPAVFDNRVYAAGYARTETPVLRCFEAETGKLAWERELSDPVTPPVATEAGVFVGDGSAVVVCDRSDGAQLASIDTTAGEVRAIAVADGVVFALAADGLSAVSVPGGSERWFRTGTPRQGGLAVGRETVVATISSERFDLETAWPCVAAFDRTDGATRWFHAFDDAFDPVIGAPPILADGAVFAMSNTRSGVTAFGDLPPRTDTE